jgi:hypothetical protein
MSNSSLVTVKGPSGEVENYRLCRDCLRDWSGKQNAMAPGWVMVWQEMNADIGCEWCEIGLGMKAVKERLQRREHGEERNDRRPVPSGHENH